MSSNVTLNGVQYIVPAFNDTGWAQGVGNLSLYLVAIASNTLQPTGGAFTLTSELDFGANFGVKQLYLKSETANPASAGVVRLASVDTIKWRNNANGADIALSKDASDNLQYNATKVLLSGAVVNADINAAAAIAYSKLALTGSIVNADVSASAAIAYSKLALTSSIVNGDVSASAAIAYSKLALTGAVVNADIGSSAAIALTKLAALTASRVPVLDVSGFITASTVTATTLGYLDATSSIQTQLDGKAGTSGTLLTTTDQTASGIKTFSGQLIGKGTAAADNAAAGNIGEYVESVISSFTNAPTTTQWGDLTSISLTAGDWDVGVNGEFTSNGGTWSQSQYGIGTTSGNNAPISGTRTQANWANTATVITGTAAMTAHRLSISGTTTVYLKYSATFSAGTPQALGKIWARRRR